MRSPQPQKKDPWAETFGAPAGYTASGAKAGGKIRQGGRQETLRH
jgi:hypothetical protein